MALTPLFDGAQDIAELRSKLNQVIIALNAFELATAIPAGSTTQLQYNNAGVFGAISGATTDGTVVTLTSPIFTAPTLGAATGTSLSIGALTITGATFQAASLATSEPHVVGRVWSNAGVLTVSAG